MARTKASVGAKVAVGKSSKARCSVATPTTSIPSGSGERSKGYSGGNPVCPRETPKWQKPITNFFICKDGDKSKESVDDENHDDEAAGSSKRVPRSNVIHSDDEEEILKEKPKNKELDETIELEPLDGDNSHKMEEYYTTGGKGKGVGKKTKGKENRTDNKRERDDDVEENVSKKIKVNGSES